jgi:hypothetical protein
MYYNYHEPDLQHELQPEPDNIHQPCPATPMEESCAKQTQVVLLGGWSADDVASRLIVMKSEFIAPLCAP